MNNSSKKNDTRRNNKYYLMRHGESLANRNGLIVSHPENAIDDYGLTAKGAEQVMNAALHTRLNIDTLIVSSDYKRAKETADIMHGVLGCKSPVATDATLRERDFGDWELSDHQNYQQIWHNDVHEPESKINQVETVTQVLERVLTVIDRLDRQHNDKTILLVGHGDVLQILLAHHHNINPRFHRSLTSLANADIRSLAKLDLLLKSPAA